MEKNYKFNIYLLLTILILFSASVGILHGRKQYTTSDQYFYTLTIKQLYEYLHPYIVARDIDSIAQIISKVNQKTERAIIYNLIESKNNNITIDELVHLIFATIFYNPNNKQFAFSTLETLILYQNIFKEIPISLIISQSMYHTILPLFFEWIDTKKGTKIYAEFLSPLITAHKSNNCIINTNYNRA